MGLVGRDEECRELDRILDSARRGVSATVVLRGEPGIGKSALIEYAIAAATDMQVVVLVGIESEVGLAYAALQRVLVPILHWIDRLPAPQRRALNTAFGREDAAQPDPFMVGMAALTLAAESASRQPLLWVVDDAQWIDEESLRAFAFCGRRFGADDVALIFSERDSAHTAGVLDGFPEIRLLGLADADARFLLEAEAGGSLEPRIVERVVRETAGNPLALVELGKAAHAGDLHEGAPSSEPLPLSRRLEARFRSEVLTLPKATQQWLLLASADSTGDGALLHRAASFLQLETGAAEPAEAANLVALMPRVTFRHPLIRSATYSGAGAADRRRVHAALADATDEGRDADRRAWHRAAAAPAPDETVAVALELSASRAGARGGRSVEAAFLARAADLTPDRGTAARRRLAAADAALSAGSPTHAQALVDSARGDLPDAVAQALARRAEGASWLLLGKPSTAAPMLLEAARAIRVTDAPLSRRTLLEALEAAFLSGYRTVSRSDLVAAIELEATQPQGASVADRLLSAFARYVTGGYGAAVPALRALVEGLRPAEASTEEILRWTMLASHAATLLWDHEGHERLMRQLVATCREEGASFWLADALRGSAGAAVRAGRLADAAAFVTEAREVRAATAETGILSESIALDAWRGINVDAGVTTGPGWTGTPNGEFVAAEFQAQCALALFGLGAGDYHAALAHGRAVFDADPVPYGSLILADLTEAAVRSGDSETAAEAVDRLAERAVASQSPWALGLLARSRALVAGGAEAAPLYQEAIELLASTALRPEHARAHLLYGEWLRRQKRRADARRQLRTACELFDELGVEGFAARARTELLATGEHARRRTIETSLDLTPQERHIADLAAGGETNQDIAERLFISRHTVEYHLRKVFQKLDITSRRELRRTLVAGGTSTR